MGQDGANEFLNDSLPTTTPPGGGSGSGSGGGGGGGAGGSAAAPLTFEPAAGQAGGGNAVQEILATSSHPTAAVFHVAFKVAAVASYLLLGIFTKSFVVQFVLTVTLLAFDFWTVKNVSGRLLVGLRWWNDVDEDGAGTWRFETIQNRNALNVTDGRIFWWSLYLTPIVWVLLGVVCVLKFNLSYLLLVVVALVLSSANIVGYYKCSKDATEQMRAYVQQTVLGAAMDRFLP
ncbi:hypothetical protein BU14_0051s0027 [Porphyra umbilicalis]|uniref:Golgi apparatus membrane protein TVP23 homolog n=1 Tax=Porphyra umbilicalis TaxID=2786 RepID=A0A1X6PII7_PORUM|nr:hypothetical protein BU14_0051s0027 [Porphyra umbilicalis]|eukprot:OSX80508.1 hypothetical protein BU14_0051s0027 [Porphyra umbilicalis]